MRYQFLPPLSDAEYEALRADIAANGMRHPIVVDEKGKILDGHHRARAAAELGFKPAREVVEGLTETEKRDLAFTLNTARRHMDSAARRVVAVASLKADPQLSDRQHARRTGLSHPTVAGIRAELETKGQLESFTSRLGADGRERPASRPETPARRDPDPVPGSVVATPGGPAQDQPSATAEADGQLAAPLAQDGGVREAEGAGTPEVAEAPLQGDGKADGQPVDADSHSADEAPTGSEELVGAAETAAEVPFDSAEASGEESSFGSARPAAAGAPTDARELLGSGSSPAVGAPVNPTDLVNQVLDALVPDDNPHREWQRKFMAAIVDARKVLRPGVEQAVECVDDELADELLRLAEDMGRFAVEVLKARKERYGENVIPMRRSS